MDFRLTEEQQMMRDMARRFAEERVKPGAAERDRTHEFPVDLLKECAELGFMGVAIPEEYGGAGMDYISYAIMIEEISRACASTGVILSVNNSLVCDPLLKYGSDYIKKEFLTPLAEGKKLGCFGLTEPNAGSDAANLKTTAKKDGDYYIINGSKIFITNATHADVCLLFAVTDKEKGKHGISAFVVDTKTEGFNIGTVEDKLGINASGTAELYFEDMRVPKENMLGEEGQGYKIALATLDGARVGIAAQGVGLAQAVLDECVRYAKERIQFGRPISSFQAIQWYLADMATNIEAARLLTYKGAACKQNGGRCNKITSMAKVFAAETAMEAARKGVQIFGGYGYMKEYPMERFFRDAKILEIYEGTSEIQRIVIAAQVLSEV
ncbi:acyl-CoA dehydrogenase [Thermotomaculum hydrothermale]|uniref:Cyclohexane-1-carbonyl-CoA dehydrogenase n=1 Tax=Thermotomaculum hydrothermale TaxID=981385 RepID=A0A7R6PLB6_9BACT|nr:acyl-CoA dehydrogenase [Thermotomaculum hydrothermale]BBB32212.1 acyl-CoA dehydrogenase [Thermotomaculum hydrothermale]